MTVFDDCVCLMIFDDCVCLLLQQHKTVSKIAVAVIQAMVRCYRSASNIDSDVTAVFQVLSCCNSVSSDVMSQSCFK